MHKLEVLVDNKFNNWFLFFQIQNFRHTLKQNWDSLDLTTFKYKFGDKIEFGIEENCKKGIIIDFSEDKSGKWYGICFLHRQHLFGRQIPAGFLNSSVNLLDINYLNENKIDIISKIGNYKIDFNKIKIGSKSPVMNLEILENNYLEGIEQRKKKQTNFIKKIIIINRINECYFPIEKFLKEV